jgi:ribosomal protein S18 acetylase RimI-like enzyme
MTDSNNHREPKEHPALSTRLAGTDDRSFVRELAVEVFSIYGSYGRYLTEWFDSESVVTLIGEAEQERVGLVMLGIHPNRRNPREAVAELLAIAVKPSHQSRGFGTLLMRKAIEEAPRLPCPLPIAEIHLSVAEGNSRAQRLFARRGFRLTGGEGIYPAGQRALHMVKTLRNKPDS